MLSKKIVQTKIGGFTMHTAPQSSERRNNERRVQQQVAVSVTEERRVNRPPFIGRREHHHSRPAVDISNTITASHNDLAVIGEIIRDHRPNFRIRS